MQSKKWAQRKTWEHAQQVDTKPPDTEAAWVIMKPNDRQWRRAQGLMFDQGSPFLSHHWLCFHSRGEWALCDSSEKVQVDFFPENMTLFWPERNDYGRVSWREKWCSGQHHLPWSGDQEKRWVQACHLSPPLNVFCACSPRWLVSLKLYLGSWVKLIVWSMNDGGQSKGSFGLRVYQLSLTSLEIFYVSVKSLILCISPKVSFAMSFTKTS